MGETTVEKKKRKKVWYAQIGLSQETYAKLTRLKEKLEKQVGIKLSWNEFITLHVKELEEAK